MRSFKTKQQLADHYRALFDAERRKHAETRDAKLEAEHQAQTHKRSAESFALRIDQLTKQQDALVSTVGAAVAIIEKLSK